MDFRNLLFEIGTEEIPALFMPQAIRDIKEFAAEELDEAHMIYKEIKVRATPRRITLSVSELAEAQRDSVETAKGPMRSQAFDANGKPTRAAIGFAKNRGVAVEDLKIQRIGNIEYVAVEKRKLGKLTVDMLPGILSRIIKRLAFPKSMYWADPSVRFARPVRWLVALYGNELIRLSFGNVTSGTTSRGHRFMGAPSVEIASADDYDAAMRNNFVIIDQKERKELILKGIADIERELGATVKVAPALLEENVYLTEYPVPFYGSFDKEFLEMPEEVLTLSMAKNQKYFPVRDLKGKLIANFVGISNNKARDMGIVREGNERVLRARLYDAAFFWKEDLQKSLDAMAEEQKNVTYQERLGSVYDKVQRVKTLALWLADKLGKSGLSADIARAASLAKADLVSNMVCEFSDVQGVMGREYARRGGEPEAVALAIYEQYLPRFAGDATPSSYEGAILGLADRADTITSIYKIGLEPTSSQDPYGLRRAARGINEIIWGLSLDLNIKELVVKAAVTLDVEQEKLDRIYAFLRQRLQIQLKDKGLRHEVVMLALQTIPERPLQVSRMASVLQNKSGEPWFPELITAAVRVRNILTKAGEACDAVDTAKFTSESEARLYSKLLSLTDGTKRAVAECDWELLTSLLASLAPVIAGFFEDVLVMDKDLEIRNNRLALLQKCQKFFLLIGDFGLLK